MRNITLLDKITVMIEMKIEIRVIFASLIVMLMLSSCSKDVEEYNKPALYWYGKMIASVSEANMDKADEYYSSLEGEHIGSPLLPDATLILAIAHMQNEEYLLTEHYLDVYIKRYANRNEREFAEYMKVKAKYMSLPNPRRDQVLINEAIVLAQNFEVNYPNSVYFYKVDSMATNLAMAKASLNISIAGLYERVDKPKAASYYRSLDAQDWIVWDSVDPAEIPWYREWFEGDGRASWYGFLIPDTQSVVSRNSVVDNNSTK